MPPLAHHLPWPWTQLIRVQSWPLGAPPPLTVTAVFHPAGDTEAESPKLPQQRRQSMSQAPTKGCLKTVISAARSLARLHLCSFPDKQTSGRRDAERYGVAAGPSERSRRCQGQRGSGETPPPLPGGQRVSADGQHPLGGRHRLPHASPGRGGGRSLGATPRAPKVLLHQLPGTPCGRARACGGLGRGWDRRPQVTGTWHLAESDGRPPPGRERVAGSQLGGSGTRSGTRARPRRPPRAPHLP